MEKRIDWKRGHVRLEKGLIRPVLLEDRLKIQKLDYSRPE
jgi:hypothetical protein